MMLPFARRFEVYVWEGSKTHSVRAPRKGWTMDFQPKAHELANCYGDSRQKTMHLLGRFPMKACQQIEIWPHGMYLLGIAIDQAELSPMDAQDFSFCDGFRPMGTNDSPLNLMRMFWDLKHGVSDKRFHGLKLNWDWKPGTTGWRPADPCAAK